MKSNLKSISFERIGIVTIILLLVLIACITLGIYKKMPSEIYKPAINVMGNYNSNVLDNIESNTGPIREIWESVEEIKNNVRSIESNLNPGY